MKRRLIQALMVSASLLSVSLSTTVYGQESNEEVTESTSDITSSESTESSTQAETATQPASIPIDYREYTPYGKFVNYQYQGDGTFFQLQDIIMEYPPNADGVFQVTSFAGDQARAHVFQMADSGLYELAYFESYTTVEDMRHSEDALDSQKSLILPENIEIGKTYQTGFNEENKRTILDILGQFELGGVTFTNVLKILEEDKVNQQDYYYYYAPDYGLILIQMAQEDGSAQNIVQLISTQGNVIEN